MTMDRLHPSQHMNMGPAPRTMYLNRSTGNIVMQDYPGNGNAGNRPGYSGGNVPPAYMSPGGYQMMNQRMMSPMSGRVLTRFFERLI